jgi:1,4-dihydroxy-6-naphthoate synthase
MEDIETLNEWAEDEKLDVTKMSFHKSLFLQDKYQLLQSGAALGYKCGPMIIARQPLTREEILEGPIGLPGQWTTAHLLFKHFYPDAKQKSFHRFNVLEEMVLEGKLKAAVIIHENRFTYANKGLVKVEGPGRFLGEGNRPADTFRRHLRLPSNRKRPGHQTRRAHPQQYPFCPA